MLSLDPISEGITNSNYILECESCRAVLTLYEHQSLEETRYRLQLQKQAHQQGTPTAEVLSANSGSLAERLQGKPASLIQYLDAVKVAKPSSESCQQIGELLAQLHLTEILDELSIPAARNSEWMMNTAESIFELIPASDQLILHQELEFLSRFSQLELPVGLVHGDLFPDNCLVQDKKIKAIIDFEFCGIDSLLFDLAITINAWCSGTEGQLNRLWMRDMLQAYSKTRPLTSSENRALPMMLRAAALRFWLSRLREKYNPEISQQVSKDPDQYRRILLARRQPLSGMQTIPVQ